MKKNIVIGMLVAAVMALAIAVAMQSHEIGMLQEQKRMMVSSMAERVKAMSQPAPVAEETTPLPEAKPVEPVAVPAPVPQAAPSAGATNSPFAGMAEMMKSPQMKEMMRAQHKIGIDGMYGSLSKYLNLSTNDMDALKELLLQRQTALMDSGMSMMNGSAADRKQAAEDAKTVKTDYDKKIQDLLGTQDYPVFQEYEKTAADRMSVQMFKGSLPADATLTDQQEESLIAAMAEERKALPSLSSLNNQTPDPAKFTEQGMADMLKQMEQLQQRNSERAAAILTPAQLEQFTKVQQQMNNMAAAGMKMAAQMFGSKNAAPAPAAATGP
ncbi:MAG TPA: hypothetical protein VNL17_15290 [Verrucomicrobiae bacterium]|nr:hypothetical protein [Verrucomicrobiae bacterium]